MNNQRPKDHDREDIKVVVEKKPYKSPSFWEYGAVSKLTRNVGATAGDSGPQSMATGSEPAIKQNIVRVGEHPLGVGLYLFDYKPEYQGQWGGGRKFGVMADEVEAVMPEAISAHPDGYRLVNYAMLGITHPLQ